MKFLILFAFFYSIIGLLCAELVRDSRNRWGTYLFTMASWPYLLAIEGTPRMVPVKKFWRRP